MAVLLETAGLSVTFGGLVAVNEVDVKVEAGQLVGLIGPNGAGKTTFIDAVSGFVSAKGGRITFAGQDISHLAPHRRATMGLGRTWQSLELFDDLTVLENLQVAAHRPTAKDVLFDLVVPMRQRTTSGDTSGVTFALEVLGIGALADKMPNEISQGQRKLVSAARAVAARPALICMDEPAAGLDTSESAALGADLRRIIEAGITVLLVDHDMGLVLDVCDYVYVIEFGRKIAEGTPAEIQRDPRVVEAYLGSGRAR